MGINWRYAAASMEGANQADAAPLRAQGVYGLLLGAPMLAKYDGLTRRQVADTLAMKSGVAANHQARWATELNEGARQTATVITAIEEDLDWQMSA